MTDADYDYFADVTYINMTTTGAYRDVRDENAEERMKGASSEIDADVVTVNRTACKIYLTMLGVGEDRVISY